jgi:tetratricopeptide (TPR) repeat protein
LSHLGHCACAPKSADAYNGRCWARALAGRDLDQALADCDGSLRLSPDDANGLNSRGLVQRKLGAFDRADRLRSRLVLVATG